MNKLKIIAAPTLHINCSEEQFQDKKVDPIAFNIEWNEDPAAKPNLNDELPIIPLLMTFLVTSGLPLIARMMRKLAPVLCMILLRPTKLTSNLKHTTRTFDLDYDLNRLDTAYNGTKNHTLQGYDSLSTYHQSIFSTSTSISEEITEFQIDTNDVTFLNKTRTEDNLQGLSYNLQSNTSDSFHISGIDTLLEGLQEDVLTIVNETHFAKRISQTQSCTGNPRSLDQYDEHSTNLGAFPFSNITLPDVNFSISEPASCELTPSESNDREYWERLDTQFSAYQTLPSSLEDTTERNPFSLLEDISSSIQSIKEIAQEHFTFSTLSEYSALIYPFNPVVKALSDIAFLGAYIVDANHKVQRDDYETGTISRNLLSTVGILQVCSYTTSLLISSLLNHIHVKNTEDQITIIQSSDIKRFNTDNTQKIEYPLTQQLEAIKNTLNRNSKIFETDISELKNNAEHFLNQLTNISNSLPNHEETAFILDELLTLYNNSLLLDINHCTEYLIDNYVHMTDAFDTTMQDALKTQIESLIRDNSTSIGFSTNTRESCSTAIVSNTSTLPLQSPSYDDCDIVHLSECHIFIGEIPYITSPIPQPQYPISFPTSALFSPSMGFVKTEITDGFLGKQLSFSIKPPTTLSKQPPGKKPPRKADSLPSQTDSYKFMFRIQTQTMPRLAIFSQLDSTETQLGELRDFAELQQQQLDTSLLDYSKRTTVTLDIDDHYLATIGNKNSELSLTMQEPDKLRYTNETFNLDILMASSCNTELGCREIVSGSLFDVSISTIIGYQNTLFSSTSATRFNEFSTTLTETFFSSISSESKLTYSLHTPSLENKLDWLKSYFDTYLIETSIIEPNITILQAHISHAGDRINATFPHLNTLITMFGQDINQTLNDIENIEVSLFDKIQKTNDDMLKEVSDSGISHSLEDLTAEMFKSAAAQALTDIILIVLLFSTCTSRFLHTIGILSVSSENTIDTQQPYTALLQHEHNEEDEDGDIELGLQRYKTISQTDTEEDTTSDV